MEEYAPVALRIHLLADVLVAQVHALAISALTSQQWVDKGSVTSSSPACMGGMKAEQHASGGGRKQGSDGAPQR